MARAIVDCVNPWSLQRWIGHKRIEETLIYVNFANAHRSPVPQEIRAAGVSETDADRRVLRMLSVRGAADLRGTHVAPARVQNEVVQEYQFVS